MTASQRIFYGKVMLFGEYSVIEGSDALLIPYRKVHAFLRMPEKSINTEALSWSNRLLKSFAKYLSDLPISPVDNEKLADDLNHGLYLESTIPANHGLGSSGSVCAAIYESYGKPSSSISLISLKNTLANMESFFHGKSSGADPLCIFTDAPLLICEQQPVIQDEQIMNHANKLNAFLVHGGKESKTDLLVWHFHEQMTHESYRTDFRKTYMVRVNEIIRSWVNGKAEFQNIRVLSEMQLHFFKDMIPREARTLWNEGIASDVYAMKICGSGGGGMMLGFTKNSEETLKIIGKEWMIEWLT